MGATTPSQQSATMADFSAILTVRDVNINILLTSKYICLQCIHRKKLPQLSARLFNYYLDSNYLNSNYINFESARNVNNINFELLMIV